MAAFRARFGKPLGITDSYRTFLEQVAVKVAKPTLAATPGKSNHGWGTALDLSSGVNSFSSAEHAWMRANAPRFGWNLPAWARQGGSKPEAWHWESGVVVPVSSYVSLPGAVPNVAPVTTPPALSTIALPSEEDDMRYLFQADPQVSGAWFLCDYTRGTRWRVRNGAQLDLLRGDPTVRTLGGPQPMHFLDGLAEIGA